MMPPLRLQCNSPPFAAEDPKFLSPYIHNHPIFDSCYNFLSHPVLNHNELIACLQLLVLLTRSHNPSPQHCPTDE